MQNIKLLPWAIMLAAAGTGFSTAASAQEGQAARGNILEEIIVSAARRRNEDVQTTPVAVTALDAEMLERFHVDGLDDMAKLAPNLVMTHMLTTTDALTVYLRGFGLRSNDPSADPRVAIFLDGVYQPTASGALLDVYDIGEVEVQAGPQGTLAGKNSAFGAVYITSARPTGELGGALQVDYGRYDHLAVRGKLNFPIVEDVLAGRVSFVDKSGGDWVKDLGHDGDRRFGGENTQAGRVSFLYTPNDQISWDLVAARMEYKNRPNVSRFVVNETGNTPGNPQTGTVGEGLFPLGPGGGAAGEALYCGIFFSPNMPQIMAGLLQGDLSGLALANGVCPSYKYGTVDPGHDKKAHGDRTQITSQFVWEMPAVTLTAQLGHLDYRLNENTDVDGTPIAFIDAFGDITHTDQDSFEIRLNSTQGGGWNFNDKLDWLVGVYYSKLDFDFDNDLIVLGIVPSYGQEFGENKSEAVFTHVIWHFNEALSASFGARKSRDEKEHAFTNIRGADPDNLIWEDETFRDNSYEAGLQWQITDERMAYVRWAQAYQAGGFVGFALGQSYEPTTNDSWEVGFKADWFDKRLRTNIAVFYNELSDLQIQGVVPAPPPAGFLQTTTNAASAEVSGIELQTIAVPTDNLTLRFNFGYLDRKYNEYLSTTCQVPALAALGVNADCKRIPYTFSSEYSFLVAGEYAIPLNDKGMLLLNADYAWQDEQFVADPAQPGSRQPDYGLLNASIAWVDPSERYTVELYGTNLTDKKYILQYSNSGDLTQEVLDGRPLEYGIRVNVKFGNE